MTKRIGTKSVVYLLYCLIAVTFGVSSTSNAANPKKIEDKTLVVWAAPSTGEQSGGTALTIDMANPDAFDGIVFAELTPNVWMAGSSGYRRTNQQQDDWSKEKIDGQFVKISVVYRGKTVEIYREDKLTSSYEVDSVQSYDDGATILFGPRHVQSQQDVFLGKIRDARIYSTALSAEQVASLKPSEALEGIEPWAWWDFATSGLTEKTGRFDSVTILGGAKIEDGALVLSSDKDKVFVKRVEAGSEGKPVAIPSKWSIDGAVPEEAIESARLLHEKALADPFRPRWHFAIPEGNGQPGDPNGCFWANGVYHLMYLYARSGNNFCWGHLASVDLLHWRNCPDAIGPGDGDDGCFSGGAFLDDDGSAYLTYWQLWGALGIGMAKSEPPYDRWTKLPENPIIRSTEFGVTELDGPDGKIIYGSADPSNIWKKDGKYYVLTGSLCVLNKFGRNADSPEDQKGDRLYLFESPDLKSWEYKGVFYQRKNEWTDASEDNMCPSFLPLPSSPEGGAPSGKWLLLFISHNKGCQYYVGEYDQKNDRFIPENHGRMTWVDNTYFAPEALVDGKGRQIMWAWLLDNNVGDVAAGWNGAYGMPRTLWVGEDGTLRMRPVPEYEALRLNETALENVSVPSNAPVELSGFPGDSFEAEIVVSASELAKASQIGLIVRENKADGEKTTLCYDAQEKSLVFDSRSSGKAGRPALEAAPLELPEGEDLKLRVFVDKSIVEVYANDRQAICRRVYPSDPNAALDVSLWNGGDATIKIKSVRTWEIAPSNPY